MKKKVITSLIVVGLLSLSVIGCFLLKGEQPSEFEKSVNKISQIDYAERQEQLNQIVEDGMMNVQYTPYAKVKEGVVVDFNIKNIENNKYPIQFTIIDEDGNSVYESKKIDLGYELNSIELNKELSKGTYKYSIKIGYAEEGNVSSVFPITLEVL